MEQPTGPVDLDQLKALTRTDLQAIANLYCPPGRSLLKHQLLGPSRTDNPDDPFEKALCEFCKERGPELLRAAFIDLEKKGEVLHISRKAKLAEEIYEFLKSEWHNLGHAPIIWLHRGEEGSGFCGLRETLYDEAKKHRGAEGKGSAGAEAEPTLHSPTVPHASKDPKATAPAEAFPHRATWLQKMMKAQNCKLSAGGPPDRKTLQKILAGKPVRSDSLLHLSEMLAVDREDIPND